MTSAGGQIRKRPLFPIIRHLSAPVTRVLARTRATPTQITVAAMITGLGGSASFAAGGFSWTLTGALLLVLNYVFDNSDGEIARLKGLTSKFGHQIDSFSDWIVNASVFPAIGFAAYQETQSIWWFWAGLIGFAGATISYVLSLMLANNDADSNEAPDPEIDKFPQDWRENLQFAFRELSRADFCFIVLFLALFDVLWLIVPAGAVGAQVYWLALLYGSRKKFHV